MRPERRSVRCERGIIGCGPAAPVVRRSGLDRARLRQVTLTFGPSGRCCAAITAVLRPLRDATSVGGDPPGVRRVFRERGFLPGKALAGAPIPDARRNVVQTASARADARENPPSCVRHGHATHGCGNRHPLPPGRRRRVRLRLSRRRGAQHLRRAVQAGQGQARPGPARAGRGPRGRRLLALVDQGRRVPRHLGSGRHQRGHRHRHRVHGFDPDGRADRPGAHARDRPGRVPGVRHGRHHAAVRQAQLPRQGREGHRGHDQEGVLPRGHRPAGPGAGRHPEGRDAGEDRVELSEDGVAALVQPGHQGALGTDQEGRAAAARGEEADGLRRRRRGPERRGAAADAARAPARLPVHEHADGPRRHSPAPTRSSPACSACTARSSRTWRCRTATC